MPWIQHYSRQDVREGLHYWDDRTALIQIKDVLQDHVKPALKFVEILQLTFEDVEIDPDEIGMQPEHAKQVVDFLRMCLEKNLNVVVHCHAGICRSSAVAIVAEQMGFQLEPKVRMPNQLVMHRMFLEAGLEDKSTFIKMKHMHDFLYEDRYE